MSATEPADREATDRANAKFWDELCGTTFARQLGISDRSIESLERFDQAYMDLYPYLLKRVPVGRMQGKKVLEIGLGYGTLGQKIAEAGADYTGLDIAPGPVAMMNHRLAMQGLGGRAIQGSMLECPLTDASLDCVVSIGCFHHTGNVARCIDETWRVLKPGGYAYLMVYNAFSYRQWIKWPGHTLRAALAPAGGGPATESQRRAYDFNSAGAAAPETVFVSRAQLRAMMARFSELSLVLENCEDLNFRGRTMLSRATLLPSLGALAGLDIYVSARK
jgi:SAM-dependent methyltransferase